MYDQLQEGELDAMIISNTSIALLQDHYENLQSDIRVLTTYERESTSVKLARNCIFSFEERVSESITSPISLTKFDNIFIFSFLKVLHSSNNFIPKNRTREKGKLYHFILNTQHHEYNHITCKK